MAMLRQWAALLALVHTCVVQAYYVPGTYVSMLRCCLLLQCRTCWYAHSSMRTHPHTCAPTHSMLICVHTLYSCTLAKAHTCACTLAHPVFAQPNEYRVGEVLNGKPDSPLLIMCEA